ncbi:MAG: glycosyltransferase family 2 protein, partial [Proteobacteria bacterium]|nr:glycosyltransferase family 2 protein [Pseudomonadota bacterium]
MSGYSLSIILPARGNQESLNRFLEDLLKNQDDKNWELIVVDDYSQTPLSIEHYQQTRWKLFRTKNKIGAAAARNY